MIKGAKSFQQKYEKIMGESSADKLWNDVKNGINEFTKKIELGQADGYFWNMYFNLLRENRILFEGVNKAIVTGDMNYMLKGIYQENRFNCIYQNRSNSGGAQTINFIEVVIAYSCNDYSLLEKIMPFKEGPATCGYSAPFYNMLYAVTYHDNEVGNKAQAELSAFMGKKRTQFDLKLAKFFYDLYQKDVDGINCGLQELCESMGKCNWINEHIYGMDKNIRSLGNTVAIFIHGLYHIVMKFLKDTPLSEKIKTPEHKSFIKEYEEFNKEHDFPEPQILVDFDQLAKFINLSIRTEFIPEVSFYKSGRNYVNDGKKFEKILGVFPLTENTDTIFHSKPRAKVDDQEVKVWRILLVPIQGEPLGDVDFYKALEYFKKIKCDMKGEEILVKGFSKQELEKILQFCN